MITVELDGGLGNQMFQYAAAKSLAYKKNTDLALNVQVFDKCELRQLEINRYDINANIVKNKNFLRKVMKRLNLDAFTSSYYVEKSIRYRDISDLSDDVYLKGYFQSEKYFLEIRSALIKDFTITGQLSNYTKKISKKILGGNSTASIHIRRGDYVFDEAINNIHGTCDISYYEKAISLLNSEYENIEYFIFSDDIAWAKKNLALPNSTYIDSEEKRMPHEDILLMSQCHHNVIANSSFSWWGAWLNDNNNKIVIAPKEWFKSTELTKNSGDIVCSDWIKM